MMDEQATTTPAYEPTEADIMEMHEAFAQMDTDWLANIRREQTAQASQRQTGDLARAA